MASNQRDKYRLKMNTAELLAIYLRQHTSVMFRSTTIYDGGTRWGVSNGTETFFNITDAREWMLAHTIPPAEETAE